MLADAFVVVGGGLEEMLVAGDVELVPRQDTLLRELVSSIRSSIFGKVDGGGYVSEVVL